MVNYSFAAATEAEKDALLSKLNRLPSNNRPLALSLFSKYSGAFHHKQTVPKLPKSLRTFYCTSSVGQKEDTSMVYEEHITAADMTYIEKSTIDQSNCLAWHKVRLGRIRASVAHDVLHTNQEKPSKSVILKICTASKTIKSPAISWGKSNEIRALKSICRFNVRFS